MDYKAEKLLRDDEYGGDHLENEKLLHAESIYD